MSIMKAGMHGSGFHLIFGLLEGMGCPLYRTSHLKNTVGNKKLKCRVAQVATRMNFTKTIQVVEFQARKNCYAIGNSFLPGRATLIVPKGFSSLPPGLQECAISYELNRIKNNYHFIKGALGACLYMITRVAFLIFFPSSRSSVLLLQVLTSHVITVATQPKLEKTWDQEGFSQMSSAAKREVVSFYQNTLDEQKPLREILRNFHKMKPAKLEKFIKSTKIYGFDHIKHKELITDSLLKRAGYVFRQVKSA